MRTIIILSFLLPFGLLFSQQEPIQETMLTDTTIVINNKRFRITETEEKIKIEAFSAAGDSLTRIYETTYTDSTKNTKWEVSESINFPFSDFIGKKKVNSFTPHWAGVGFGFVNAMGNDFKFLNSTSPNGVALDFAQSFEIFWNILDIGIPLYKDNFGLVLGLGLDWRNYVMTENKRFIYSDYRIQVEPMSEDQNLSYSRLKTVDLTLPVMLEYQMKLGNNKAYIQGGALLNFRTHSSLKTKYISNDLKQKYFKDGIGSNPVNVDLMLKIGFEYVGFYAKYTPTRMFQPNKGPAMHSFSTGVAVTF